MADDQKKGTNSLDPTASGLPHTKPSASDSVLRGISDVVAQRNEDVASENEIDTASNTLSLGNTGQQDNETALSDDGNNTMQTPVAPPSIQGEQSVSGDMPDPESDDDTLANAQAVGQQLDEDPEHPKELDIARDIDKAEEALREH